MFVSHKRSLTYDVPHMFPLSEMFRICFNCPQCSAYFPIVRNVQHIFPLSAMFRICSNCPQFSAYVPTVRNVPHMFPLSEMFPLSAMFRICFHCQKCSSYVLHVRNVLYTYVLTVRYVSHMFPLSAMFCICSHCPLYSAYVPTFRYVPHIFPLSTMFPLSAMRNWTQERVSLNIKVNCSYSWNQWTWLLICIQESCKDFFSHRLRIICGIIVTCICICIYDVNMVLLTDVNYYSKSLIC